MRLATWLGILLGLGALAGLVAWQGVASIAGRLGAADWALVLVAVFALPEAWFSAISWRQLFAAGRRPAFRPAFLGMWMGTSVNLLVPSASIGGEVVKARHLMQRGTAATDAVASVVVDKAVQAIAVLLWTLIGVAVLLLYAPDGDLLLGMVAGAALLLLGIGGFIVVQRAGAFSFLARAAVAASRNERWQRLVQGAAGLDATIRALYARPSLILRSSLWRLLARVVMAGEVWLAAWLMGLPIGLAEAVILKSLSFALRSAAFMVPGGIGVQEGGYVALGALIGLPPDMMISLSLATRIRELVAAVPGLLAWQVSEGRMLWLRGAGRAGTKV